MHRSLLILLLLPLTVLNNAVAASAGAPKSPTLESAAAAFAPKPLLIPAAKSAAKIPAKAAKAPATPAPKSPAAKAAPATSSKSAANRPTRPTTAAQAAASRAVKRTKLAPIKLNLSLPPELLENIEFGTPLTHVDEVPVLPPMFGEAKSEPSAYQLSGKLIDSERKKQDSDNYLDSIDGAQLSIEFRQ